eukprot:3912278-Alexandrium_andersonii.AAC.1
MASAVSGAPTPENAVEVVMVLLLIKRAIFSSDMMFSRRSFANPCLHQLMAPSSNPFSVFTEAMLTFGGKANLTKPGNQSPMAARRPTKAKKRRRAARAGELAPRL